MDNEIRSIFLPTYQHLIMNTLPITLNRHLNFSNFCSGLLPIIASILLITASLGYSASNGFTRSSCTSHPNPACGIKIIDPLEAKFKSLENEDAGIRLTIDKNINAVSNIKETVKRLQSL